MALITDFITSWIERERAGTLRPVAPASWAWKTSYVMGLIMAEQLKGLLGTQAPVTPAMIDTMARQAAEVTPGPGGRLSWDPAGFRVGMEDLLAVGPLTLPNIRALLTSGRIRVLPEEMYLLVRELRGRSGFPNVGL